MWPEPLCRKVLVTAAGLRPPPKEQPRRSQLLVPFVPVDGLSLSIPFSPDCPTESALPGLFPVASADGGLVPSLPPGVETVPAGGVVTDPTASSSSCCWVFWSVLRAQNAWASGRVMSRQLGALQHAAEFSAVKGWQLSTVKVVWAKLMPVRAGTNTIASKIMVFIEIVLPKLQNSSLSKEL